MAVLRLLNLTEKSHCATPVFKNGSVVCAQNLLLVGN